MISRIMTVVGLWAMWVALWGDASPGTVVAGLLVAAGVAAAVPSPPTDRRWVVRPLGVARFVLTFYVQLVVSTWAMVRLVLSSRARRTEGVLIEVELAESSYPVRTLIAHSISLTPGTLTVDVRPDGRTLLVHVIDADDVAEARAAILALEVRAREAFAPTPTPAGEAA